MKTEKWRATDKDAESDRARESPRAAMADGGNMEKKKSVCVGQNVVCGLAHHSIFMLNGQRRRNTDKCGETM